MKNFKDIRKHDEGYVSHAQRKAVWAARNDEKKKKSKKESVDLEEGAKTHFVYQRGVPKTKQVVHRGTEQSSKDWITKNAKHYAHKGKDFDIYKGKYPNVKPSDALNFKHVAEEVEIEEAPQPKWIVTVVKPVNKLRKGTHVIVPARNTAEALKKALKRMGENIDVAIGARHLDVKLYRPPLGESAELEGLDEAKDPNEYDKEGEMMKGQLRQICSANEKLMKMVGDDDNLPEWVQNKVTKATDYIRSVRDYLESENDKDSMSEASKSDMLCKECGDQFGKPTNEKCMYDAYDQLGENWVTKEMYEGLDITEISLDMLSKKISNTNLGNTRKAMKTDKVKTDLAKMRARLDNKKDMKPIKAQVNKDA